MTYEQLFDNIRSKRSFLCIGLDSDIEKIPQFLRIKEDPIFEFNKSIVDATHQYAVAYKPNIAFYESLGSFGWRSLEKTVEYIRANYPDMFLIADAKRGDIGNTSRMYAKAFFESMDFDAVTVAPYMGEDSVRPFLEYDNKWVIILALTSNDGAEDFQFLYDDDKRSYLYEEVIIKSREWGSRHNTMYVMGAIKTKEMERVRDLVPDHFLLVPGIGAQGGDLDEVARYAMNRDAGILANASRSIIFAGSGEDFAEQAAEEAKKLQQQMSDLLDRYCFDNKQSDDDDSDDDDDYRDRRDDDDDDDRDRRDDDDDDDDDRDRRDDDDDDDDDRDHRDDDDDDDDDDRDRRDDDDDDDDDRDRRDDEDDDEDDDDDDDSDRRDDDDDDDDSDRRSRRRDEEYSR